MTTNRAIHQLFGTSASVSIVALGLTCLFWVGPENTDVVYSCLPLQFHIYVTGVENGVNQKGGAVSV